jgi:hypothetical protein
MTPYRVQLKRTTGWRLPSNTVIVSRPSKWGNPYYDIRRYGLDLCLRMFRNTAHGCWMSKEIPDGPMNEMWTRWLYEDHCRWTKRIGIHPVEAARAELRGKNLACWCPLDRPCHADILLEIANTCT